MLRNVEVSPSKCEKLILDLQPKKHYIVHFRALKKYLELGVQLDKVHQVLGYTQEPWLRSFIDLCTTKRAVATTDFEKDF